jgi:hypothetical protein
VCSGWFIAPPLWNPEFVHFYYSFQPGVTGNSLILRDTMVKPAVVNVTFDSNSPFDGRDNQRQSGAHKNSITLSGLNLGSDD